MKIEREEDNKTDKPVVSQERPFRLLNLTFASRKTFVEFIITSLLIIVFPIASVVLLNNWVQDKEGFSELEKVAIAVVPAVIFINIVTCTYAVKAMKNPENYEVDPPLKLKLKKN